MPKNTQKTQNHDSNIFIIVEITIDNLYFVLLLYVLLLYGRAEENGWRTCNVSSVK